MHNPYEQQARRAYEAQQRQESWNRYFRWQAFKLVYILCVIFVMPAVIIGGFALYLAVYEPDQFRQAIKSRPQPPRVDDLENPSFFIRQSALQKLTQGTADRTRRDVAEKIKRLLADANPAIAELAIDSLGDWGQPEDAEALGTLAKERMSVFVRPKICAALGKLQGEQALDALIDVLGMGWTEQDHATRALAKFGPAAEAALLKRGVDAPAEMRGPICGALQTLGGAQSVPYLQSQAQDENPRVADAARKALAAIALRTK